RLLVCSVAMLSLVGCKKENKEKVDDESHGIVLEYMDPNVKPGDDFFRYVNGAWYDKAEIPADRTRWGSFDELRKNTDQDALAILKEAAADKSLDPKSDQAKAVAVFQTFLDTVSRNNLG